MVAAARKTGIASHTVNSGMESEGVTVDEGESAGLRVVDGVGVSAEAGVSDGVRVGEGLGDAEAVWLTEADVREETDTIETKPIGGEETNISPFSKSYPIP